MQSGFLLIPPDDHLPVSCRAYLDSFSDIHSNSFFKAGKKNANFTLNKKNTSREGKNPMNRTFFYNQLSINGYHVKEGIIPFKKRVFLTIEGPYRFMWTHGP